MPNLRNAIWCKSTYSQNIHECVEVAALGATRAVRDSKNPVGAVLTVTAAAWAAFTAGVRVGEFD